MDIIRKREALKTVTKVANCSSISNIYLLNSNVFRSPEAATSDKINGDLGFDGELLKREEESFSAKVKYSLKGSSEDDDVLVEISGEFVVVYTLKPESELSDEEVEEFCNTNALFNAWPFIREYIVAMCSRMEIPPLTLPLLRIVPERKKRKQAKKMETDKADKEKVRDTKPLTSDQT